MIDVLILLHQVDICHYDIKDDNWVLTTGVASRSTHDSMPIPMPLPLPMSPTSPVPPLATVRLCLIDFGIAQDLASNTPAAPGGGTGTGTADRDTDRDIDTNNLGTTKKTFLPTRRAAKEVEEYYLLCN